MLHPSLIVPMDIYFNFWYAIHVLMTAVLRIDCKIRVFCSFGSFTHLNRPGHIWVSDADPVSTLKASYNYVIYSYSYLRNWLTTYNNQWHNVKLYIKVVTICMCSQMYIANYSAVFTKLPLLATQIMTLGLS